MLRQIGIVIIDMMSCFIRLLVVASHLFACATVSGDSGVVVRPPPNQNLTWWQTGVVYQIYPRSFKDSDGDGIGDIRGIISELDYFTYLGIDCIWLSPVCRSPMKDFGYDCSDYVDIDPVFGTLDDYKNLVDEAHKKGLKVLADFVSVYSSDQHDWFQKSVRRQGKYTGYYVWDDGILLPNGTRTPPNNWLSIFGGSAWQWNDERKQFYYHVFLKEQPDLNHRDANVRWEMLNILRYWLDLGVDGFRLDAISALFEAENISLNEPPSGRNVPQDQEDYLNHTYTQNQPEVYPEVTSWNELLQEYSRKDGKERYMIIEIYEGTQVRNKLYATGGSPFNFDLLGMNRNLTAREVYQTVMNEYDNLPAGKWPNFVLGNHDSRRISHQYGPQYVNVFNTLILTLWGTPTTYYGEELGMLEADLRWDQTLDPWGLFYGPSRYEEFSRDPERTPMQWTSGPHSGFTTGNTTWRPLANNFTSLNVQTEKDGSEQTSLKLYKQLVALRKKQAFQTGDFKPAVVTDDVFSYFRVGDRETYLVVLNFRDEEANDWSTYAGVKATAVIVTPGVTNIKEGQEVDLLNLRLGQGQGLVLQVSSTISPIIG